MQVFILLDASGSMVSRWGAALEGINSYVHNLAKEQPNAVVTLTAFASRYAADDRRLATTTMFQLVRNAQRAAGWQPITENDVKPEGGTPLYDAIGRVTNLMAGLSDERAVLIVETDGEENMSKELTREGAKVALDGIRKKGWQVVFLGADFDAFNQSGQVGVGISNTLNMRGEQGRRNTYSDTLVKSTVAYASAGIGMNFTDADREAAKGNIKK